MMWLVQFLIIGLAIAAIVLFSRRKTVTSRSDQMSQRVSAYAQTVRRTGEPADLNAMSDLELNDVLTASARRLHVLTQRKFTMLIVGAAAVVIVSVFLAQGQGPATFLIGAIIGSIVLYGLERAVDRQIRKPLIDQGIEPNRLLID